jgi:hypothetical protein
MRPTWPLEQEIGDLRSLLDEFTGAESAYMRWLLNNRINSLRSQVRTMRGQTISSSLKPEPPPMPDWLSPYLETSVHYQQEDVTGERAKELAKRPSWAQGRTKTTTPTLRPIGAQAELTPDQLAFMSGYEAWGRAGAPQRWSEEAFREMSDVQKWWTPYVALSQKLFPTATKLRQRWATATQGG